MTQRRTWCYLLFIKWSSGDKINGNVAGHFDIYGGEGKGIQDFWWRKLI
jgi:hypothetical protein